MSTERSRVGAQQFEIELHKNYRHTNIKTKRGHEQTTF